MYALLCVVGGFLLVLLLLLKKLFYSVTDDAPPATRNDDEASSSATQDCDSSDSTSSGSGQEYDVFLSFRGVDTRTTFTDHLYEALDSKGIHTFRDNEELRIGEEIGPALLSAIRQSKVAIIIFSKDYASSKWCLRELSEISKCRKKEGQRQMIVFPVFYHVNPTEVRNQTGSYGTAFQHHHQKKIDKETLLEWRKALRDVGQLKGWDLKNTADGYEGKLVRLIVDKVWSKLDKIPVIISKDIVGMDSHVEKIEELLSFESKGIVGIHGMGGIGKTTIARCVYNKVYHDFQGYCFLEDVRETAKTKEGIIHLQIQLVNNILNKKNTNIGTVHEGTAMIKQRFFGKKVFIIVDDVDEFTDLNAIIGEGDSFGVGSKIIITTRDKRVLDKLGVDNPYKPNEMNPDQSLVLFSRHAFKMDHPPEEYLELSRDVVKTTGGLPLALKVTGSNLYLRQESVWKNVVKKLANNLNKEVQKTLRISYDGLDHEEQVMFLDIACFFIGREKDTASYIWDGSDFAPHLGIENLCLKSLIEINERNEFSMHDQLRDLGREIVRRENFDEPGKRSRLWSLEDVKEILSTQEGTEKFEGLQYNHYFDTKPTIVKGFGSMTRLRILELIRVKVVGNLEHSFPNLRYLSWQGCPMQFVPRNLRRLCVLDLFGSDIAANWKGWQYIEEVLTLKVLKLSRCDKLSRIPNLSTYKQLEVLLIDECYNLVEVDESIGHLKGLVTLNMSSCRNLTCLPNNICELSSLKILNLQKTKISELPEGWGVHLEALTELHFDFSERRLPYLPNIQILSTGVYNRYIRQPRSSRLGKRDIIPLLELPPSLRYLDASRCTMKSLPPSLPNLTNLMKLYLLDCPNLVEIPATIDALPRLESLTLGWCPELQCIPHLPSTLTRFEVYECENLGEILGFLGMRSLKGIKIDNCSKLAKIESLEGLDSLQLLKMRTCCSLAKLPKLQCLEKLCKLDLEDIGLSEIEGLEGLEELRISNCNSLSIIPNLSASENLIGYCNELSDIVGLEKLGSLKILDVCACPSLRIRKLPKRLCELKIDLDDDGSLIEELRDLKYLTKLQLQWRSPPPLRVVTDLSNMKALSAPPTAVVINFFEASSLESLEELTITNSGSLELLPNLSPLKNLKDLSLTHSERVTEIPTVGRLGKLKKLMVYKCISIEFPNISDLTKLQRLQFTDCKKLTTIQGLDRLENLENLSIDGCISIETLPSLSNLKKLRSLSTEGCGKLLEIQGLDRLENLEDLYIDRCISIETLPSLSNLKKLQRLSTKGCEKLLEIHGLDRLENLEDLCIDGCISIETLPSLSNLKKLWWLSTNGCEKLLEIHGLDRLENLEDLFIDGCISIETLPSLSNLKKLRSLSTEGCGKLLEIQGLDRLENLEDLYIDRCISIETLPSLSNLKKLQRLSTKGCEKLLEIHGLDRLENLEDLCIDGCISIETLPSLSNLKKLWWLSTNGCEKLLEIHGLDRLENLEDLFIDGCISIETLPSQSNLKNLRCLSTNGCEKLLEIHGLDRLEYLEDLCIDGCISIETLPSLSNLKKLRWVSTEGCEKLLEIQWLDRLENLEELSIDGYISIETLPSLSNLKKLKILSTEGCEKLLEIHRLDRLENLEDLCIDGCISIETLPSLSNLKKLRCLSTEGCEKLLEIHGLDRLENLEKLSIDGCISIETLPSLSNLKKLRWVSTNGCKKLLEIHGLDRLENLMSLSINGCISIETLPSLSNLKKLRWVSTEGCEKLLEIHGLDRLENLEKLSIDGCISIETLPSLSNLKKLKILSTEGCEKLSEYLNIDGCISIDQ